MNKESKHFQVAVLGGGVTGSAIFHVLSKYTNINSIALIEKCDRLGQINSKENNNSQTLHFGDIEANYSFEKAKSTKAASEMVVNYLNKMGDEGKKMYTIAPKLLLAVGEKEINIFNERFKNFKEIFPDFKKIYREDIAMIEPEIVNGRKADEQIVAGYSENGYTVDFGKLAESFVEEAKKDTGKDLQVFLNTKVEKIIKKEKGFSILTDKEKIVADIIVVAMCSHSLMFAKSLGYGKEFSILPVGGNFYTSERKVLNCKVYTMQNDKMPFAGVHGDPNIYDEDQTRFGPTANIIPFLERNNLKTFFEFIRSTGSLYSVIALFRVISDKILFTFLFKSLIYEIPYFGPRAYVKLCRKIIPTLKYEDFKNGKSKAGIRPQLVDNRTGKFKMGEAEIIGDNIIFNISPSPGASVCLANAAKNAKRVIDFSAGKFRFEEGEFDRDLLS